jgi:hypothetical protein
MPLPAHPGLEGVLAVRDENAVAAVENDVPVFRAQIVPGNVDAEAVGPADAVEDVHGHLGINDVAARGRDGQGPFTKAAVRVGDQQVRVDAVLDAEPAAGRAGPVRGIEREEAPRQFETRRAAAETGIEEPQVIIQFGQGADGRPGIGRGRDLGDGDHRGQPVHPVHGRPAQLAHELTGIR